MGIGGDWYGDLCMVHGDCKSCSNEVKWWETVKTCENGVTTQLGSSTGTAMSSCPNCTTSTSTSSSQSSAGYYTSGLVLLNLISLIFIFMNWSDLFLRKILKFLILILN